MADTGAAQVTQAAPSTAPDGAPTPAPQAPQGVLVGAGGDPIVLGLAVFCAGTTALGMALIGVVPPTALAVVVPVIAGASGLYQIVSVVWALFLGQTFVAVVFGIFSGFWLSLSMLLLGLGHGWYGIAAADLPRAQALFFITWATAIFFLLIPCLRLPAIYPAIVGLVVVALVLATLGAWFGLGALIVAAGWVVLLFTALGFWAFLNVSATALGAKAFLPLGPPLLK
jgi:succinate-acetate transporter protein